MERGRPDAAMRSEAAAWLARLHSEERTAADEAGFRAWLDEDVRRQEAFDLVNTAWETAGGVRRDDDASPAPGGGARRASVLDIAAAALVVLCLGAGAAALLTRPPLGEIYDTAVGEQRQVTLSDGSRMMLDTATVVQVTMGPARRLVELQRGRAHFDVAKDNRRPFAVSFGDRQVVAVGTAFDVTREGERASVVLTHGQVLLESAAGRRLMSPGERLTFNREKIVEDRPDLDDLGAWQSGRAVFENELLRTVVSEMNRYNRKPIVIPDAKIGELRVSGRYKAGDSEGFAVSLAALLPVCAEVEPGRIVLAGDASGKCKASKSAVTE